MQYSWLVREWHTKQSRTSSIVRCSKLLGDGSGLFVGHLVHILEDVAERQLHDFHAVARANQLRVADDALQAEGRHGTVRQHQCTGVGHHFAHPQEVGYLVQVLQVHAHVCLDAYAAAVCSEVDAFVAVLHDDHGFAVALEIFYK